MFLEDEGNAAAQIGIEQVQSGVGRQTGRESRSVRSLDAVALFRFPEIHLVDAVPVVDDSVRLGSPPARVYREFSRLQTLVFLINYSINYCCARWRRRRRRRRRRRTYADEETEHVVRNDPAGRHHVFGQLDQRIVVTPQQFFDGLLDDHLLVEHSEQRAGGQSGETLSVFQLSSSRLLTNPINYSLKLDMIIILLK